MEQVILLPVAANWLELIRAELKKRDRQIEQDGEITGLTIRLIIGKRTRNPVKITSNLEYVRDLTSPA